MPFRPFENQNCSIARAAEIFTERWTMLILREISVGNKRFSGIKRNTGVASNILSDRLQMLVEQGIVVRVESDGHESYRMTRKGVDAQQILMAMLAWGDKYEAPNGAPREMIHETCGHAVHAKMVCDHCGEELKANELHMRPGPGATEGQRRRWEEQAAS